MHIKRIVIQGFKTYKNITIIDAFSAHHNVVVGRNGSGKSNFFAAIRFVLSDAYTNMSREERQSLIHEGSGTVMSAYVEIIFDNTDRRIPIDKDEISIRRTIGMKKDDYSLDSKSATKMDIMNLLESAGFSKSNPYYIVPQGKITALTNAKDSERLQLMKEVAGAKVFETKLKDSRKEMANTNKKREQIDEMLRYIESRLDDLDMEKNDLKSYEKLNNKKKVLEYNLLDRELNNLTEQITTIETEYGEVVENTNELVEKLTDREKMAKVLESQLVELNSNKKILEIDKQENDNEVQEVLSKIGETKAQLQEVQVDEDFDADVEQQLSSIKKVIRSKERKVQDLKPELDILKTEETTLKNKLQELNFNQRTLLSKRGRFDQFSNVEERNAWLKHEIHASKNSLEAKRSQLERNREAFNDIKTQLENIKESIGTIGSSESIEKELKVVNKDMITLKLQYNELIDERKKLWREESKLNQILHNYEEEKIRAQQNLGETMDRSLAVGLEAVYRISKSLGLSGVYGTLGELIDVSEKYKNAAEVVGGNSLFHVVVDNDQTASLIMDELIREKAGRVTFIPLNRLNPSSVTYPEGSDSVPLIKKIAFDDHLEPAVRQIFGRTVVCISLERGFQIAKQYKLNAITLDGDRCDRKGVLTGGYRDQTHSRVDSLRDLTKWKSEIISAKAKLDDLKTQITHKDAEITNMTESVNEKRKHLDSLFSKKDSLLAEREKLVSEKSRYEEELSSMSSRIEQFELSISSLQKQVLDYQQELNSDFQESSLSVDEQQYVTELSSKIPVVEGKYNKIVSQLETLSLEHSSLISELSEKLYPKLKQLSTRVNSNTISEPNNLKLKDLKRRLESLKKLKESLDNSNYELKEKLRQTNGDLTDKQAQLEKLNTSQRSLLRKLENYSKTSERSIGKKILLTNRREEINKKIGDLGVLPDSAFSSFDSTSSNELLSKLNKVTDELKQYSHINKKALEQFVNFAKQRDSLVARREELDEAKESIENLISVLEARKNDAIIRTFKEVSLGFTEIYEKLVPRGTGSLIIQRGDADQTVNDANDEDDNDNSANPAVDSYIGVSISVSFNSKKDEQQRIEQLSGGQKSLCAIALILAIQRCDPAPFYLFDEIDANLDTQYRNSVSKLINELAQNAQFICTTFRPEMLKVADKFYGVMFNNKVSTVSEITRDDALTFVEGQQRA